MLDNDASLNIKVVTTGYCKNKGPVDNSMLDNTMDNSNVTSVSATPREPRTPTTGMDTSEESSRRNMVMPAPVIPPSWMDGFNNVVDVGDKMDDSINRRVRVDNDDESDCSNLNSDKRSDKRSDRELSRFNRALRYHSSHHRHRREKSRHSPIVFDEDDDNIDSDDGTDHELRFSPSTIVTKSDNDNNIDDGDNDVGNEEESTTNGARSRSTTPPITSDGKSTHDTIIIDDEEDNDHLKEGEDVKYGEGGDNELDKKLIDVLDDNNVSSPYDQNDSFGIVHHMGFSPKKPKSSNAGATFIRTPVLQEEDTTKNDSSSKLVSGGATRRKERISHSIQHRSPTRKERLSRALQYRSRNIRVLNRERSRKGSVDVDAIDITSCTISCTSSEESMQHGKPIEGLLGLIDLSRIDAASSDTDSLDSAASLALSLD